MGMIVESISKMKYVYSREELIVLDQNFNLDYRDDQTIKLIIALFRIGQTDSLEDVSIKSLLPSFSAIFQQAQEVGKHEEAQRKCCGC